MWKNTMKIFLTIIVVLFVGSLISFYIEYKKAPTEKDD